MRNYLNAKKTLSILDVGSLDVHNPKKELNFGRYLKGRDNWTYTGLDLVEGANVDVVATGMYEYPFPDNSFDVVVSANTLEHVLDTHKFIKEIARVTRDLVYIAVPNSHPEHCFPIDCWRVFPDGMRFLLKDIAGLEVLDVYRDGRAEKKDTIGIARKIIK